MNCFEKLLTENCDENIRNQFKHQILQSYFFIHTTPVGKSILGRKIDCFHIGNSEKIILLCGSFHGMEWITSQLLYKFIIKIGNTIINREMPYLANLSECLKEYSLAIIPCVNPDGVEIAVNGSPSARHLQDFVERISKGDTSHWQSNALGVDINHNFDADWQNLKNKELSSGITFPSMTRYGGEFPESEPETRALTKFCRENQICKAIAFHSQGEEIYWSFGEHTPVQSLETAKKLAEWSGYALNFPESIATGGGFKDWLITEKSIPAFTIEVGKGKNPLPVSQLPKIYAQLEKMLFNFIV